ncbi:antitoxin Xre/MbcA/ParS toxin-binding domain-containing protein [Pseudomonas paraeruginosa]
MRNEPLRDFGYKTAIDLIEEGRADALMAYLDSLAGGAAG